MSLLMQRVRLAKGAPVSIGKFFPGMATLPVNSPVPISASLPRTSTPIMSVGGRAFTIAPTARSVVKSGVSGSLGSVLTGIGQVFGGNFSGGIQTIFGGSSTPQGPTLTPGVVPVPTSLGPVSTGPGIATGSGTSGSGTAGAGCLTILGQQVCLGGSLGGGSSFNTGGGTAGSLPGGGAGIATLPPVVASVPAAVAGSAGAVCTIKGHHLNRRGYYTHGGYVAPHTRCVKNRRRNSLNPHALARSMHRLMGFQHAARKIEKHLGQLARGAHRGGMKRLSSGRGSRASCSCKK